MTHDMRALFAGAGGPPHFRDIPAPRLSGPGQAIVRPITVALCDLDVPFIKNVLPAPRPYAVGHEFTAEVVEVGEAVGAVAPGDIVTVPFQISCGDCARCRCARTLDCEAVPPISTYGLEPFGGGSIWGGAVADQVVIPYADAMALKLPAGVDLASAAGLSDNVIDGYRCAAPFVGLSGELLILGSASVGLYACAIARALGVRAAYADTDPARLAVAERLGARLIDTAADGQALGEFEAVACCASLPESLLTAVRSVTAGGTVVGAGIHYRPPELPWVEVYKRGLTLVTGRGNARDDIPKVLDLMTAGRLDLADVGAVTVPVADAVEALSGPLGHKTVLQMASDWEAPIGPVRVAAV